MHESKIIAVFLYHADNDIIFYFLIR